MKAKFKLWGVLLSCILVFTSTCSVWADSNKTEPELRTISKTQVPQGVIPYTVPSEEAAMQIMMNDAKVLNEVNNELVYAIGTRSTTGDAYVDSRDLTFGTLTLRLAYTTSLSGNKGTITSHSPYVQHSGFTLGCEWKQSNIGSQILSSKKDVYAYCNGIMEYYFYVNGLIKLGSSPGNLSGTVAIIR